MKPTDLETQVRERISPEHECIEIFDGQFKFSPEVMTDLLEYYGMPKKKLYTLLLALKNNGTLPSSDVRLDVCFRDQKAFEDSPPWDRWNHKMFLMEIKDEARVLQENAPSYWSAIFHLKWKDAR